MRISPQFFDDNMMSIKCVASISPVIWSGNKETIIQQGLQQFEIPAPSLDTREAMFLGELEINENLFFLLFVIFPSTVRSSAITIKSSSTIHLLFAAILFLKFTHR
jgi:hypothetical protein